jgi:hypothetical protein
MVRKRLIEHILFIFTLNILKHSICQACDSNNESSEYFYKEKDSNNFTWTFIKYFKEFNDLVLDCNHTNNIGQFVSMWPKKPLIIDRSFEIKKIFDQNELNSIRLLSVGNIKGIDLNSRPVRIGVAYIIFSKLDAYSNSVLIDSDKCDLETYNTSTNFIQNFDAITIHDVIYPKKWCPYFFKNSKITRFSLYMI